MFKQNLISIKKEICNMKSRNDCLEKCINERLNNSINNYKMEIDRICDYLLSRNSFKVLRNLSKYMNEKEKENE